MEIENDKINYRRANIDDIGVLIDYRVRFLNELSKNIFLKQFLLMILFPS